MSRSRFKIPWLLALPAVGVMALLLIGLNSCRTKSVPPTKSPAATAKPTLTRPQRADSLILAGFNQGIVLAARCPMTSDTAVSDMGTWLASAKKYLNAGHPDTLLSSGEIALLNQCEAKAKAKKDSLIRVAQTHNNTTVASARTAQASVPVRAKLTLQVGTHVQQSVLSAEAATRKHQRRSLSHPIERGIPKHRECHSFDHGVIPGC